MTQTPADVLSYASAASPPRRFRHVLAIFPFTGGLVIGAGIACAVAVDAPDATLTGLAFLGFLLGTGAVAAYALTALLLVGCFSSRTRHAQPPVRSALVGFGLPMIGGAIAVAGHTFSVLVPMPPALVGTVAGCVLLLLMAGATLIAPLTLIEWQPVEPLSRRSIRSILKRVAIALIFVAMLVGLDRWASARKLERDCASAAAWVKTNYPAAGAYYNIALPPILKPLSADHSMHAMVLSDGRVVLVLKTALGWHNNWTGIVYATGPIAPDEIGVDADGSRQIRIKGMPMHFIISQQDSRHFKVEDEME